MTSILRNKFSNFYTNIELRFDVATLRDVRSCFFSRMPISCERYH